MKSISFKAHDVDVQISGMEGEYVFNLISRLNAFYEHDLLEKISSIPMRDDGAIIDVGANIGNHTVYFGKFFSNQVFSIEPVQANFQILEANIADNGLSDRVTPILAVAWDSSSNFSMSQSIPSNFGTFKATESTNEQATVPGDTLENLIGDQNIALMKVDVEGSEDSVIRGALPLITKYKPLIVAESHTPEAFRALNELLSPIGYEVLAEGGRSVNYIWAHEESLVGESLAACSHRLLINENRRQFRQVTTQLDALSRRIQTAQVQQNENGKVLAPGEDPANTLPELPTAFENAVERLSLAFESARAKAEAGNEQLITSAERINVDVSKIGSQVSDKLDDLSRNLDSLSASIQTRSVEIAEKELLLVEADLRSQLKSVGEQLDKALDDRFDFERRSAVWESAYSELANRWEESAPGRISADAAIKTVRQLAHKTSADPLNHTRLSTPVHELRKPAGSRQDSVRIGIASMRGREDGLSTVLRILSPQADEIFVYLNGMEAIPGALPQFKNIKYFTGPDYGDRAKFLFLRDFEGYYLTCDDDIEYPDFYVDYLIQGIERYGRKAVVGWHGSIFTEDFEDYYNSKYRQVLSFSTLRGKDTPVHLLGTGIAGFHTSTIQIEFSDFEYPNMADAFLARKAQNQKVPMIVLRHERGWAIPIDREAPSISNVSLGKSQGEKTLDVRSLVSKLVKDHGRWETYTAEEATSREELKVAIIGRTDKERWKKGGILKSCHLTASQLRVYGADVNLQDIETGDPIHLGGSKVDLVMIYVGDPERPDFSKVEEIVEHHAKAGRTVVINLSVNEKPSRYRSIRSKLLDWESSFGRRVYLMVFTESMQSHPELATVAHLVVTVPKTLLLPASPSVTFHNSSGIFVGDIAKLSDDSLMSRPASEWLAAIRRSVPEAKIIAVRQYQPKYKVDLDIDEVWPFLREDFAARLSTVRAMVTPIKYATFEMVPVEVASLGVPVFYQNMPQSLSEYLGLAGIRIDTPGDLEEVLPIVYRDEMVWRSQSRAGRHRALSEDIQSTSGQMYMQLRRLISRTQ
ncbi:FkbM family methyltransferase [Arthrobacter cupressi]|nr:FkbM family methyltransferase [Arthrobacter cupressi]NYD76466.1 FkbM family methyltransferase [Arthrobacter cupressi]